MKILIRRAVHATLQRGVQISSFLALNLTPFDGHADQDTAVCNPSSLQQSPVIAQPEPSPGMFNNAIPFTVLAALAILISYADRSNLSTAIIPMSQEYHWDTSFSGFVLSSFWAGYALTQVLGGRLADKFGGEALLAVAMLLWSLCTGLTPLAASFGSAPLFADRIFLGAGEGLALPAVHSMIRKYVQPSQRSTSASVITAACFGGALLSNLICPSLIASQGWRSCFTLFAIVPVALWLPLWGGFLRGGKEREKGEEEEERVRERASTTAVINSSASDNQTGEEEEELLSLSQLLRCPPVWAIIVTQYAQSWGMVGLLSWLPSYFNFKFNLPLSELGPFTSLPYLVQLGGAVLAGGLADRFISSGGRVIKVRRGLQTIGMLGPAFSLLLCATLPNLTPWGAALLLTVGQALSSLTVGGVSCSHFDLSPRNAGSIFGLGNTAACLGGLLAVPVAGWVWERTGGWESVFSIFALHYVLGAVVFWKWASDERLTVGKRL